MTDKFYELDHDFSRFEDCSEGVNEDGWLEKFEGFDELKRAFFDCAKLTVAGEVGIVKPEITEDGLWHVLTAQIPEEILISVEPELLRETDFPHIEHVNSWPIMSRRMVDILLSVGNFPHQIIPVTFMDFWDESGENINHDYVILQLGQLSDVLDRDKSIYSYNQSIVDPNKTFICDIEKLRLKEPVGGFPPIFRVKWSEVSLFVSAEAKNALETAGIKGVQFSRIWP